MEKNTSIEDWRTELSEPKATLKIADGDVVVGMLASEGEKKSHPDYGSSVAFQFLKEGEKEPKTFYVKANNFDLLGQFKALGTLTGLKVRISRIGSSRSNTRYKIVKL
jgi:hypothetical protein